MRKKLLAAMLAMSMVALSACGQDSGNSSDASAGSPAGSQTESSERSDQAQTENKETVVLEMLLADDTLEGGAMATVVAKFNEEYKDKGIQVEINEIAHADMDTQILNRASVGELPALVKHTNFSDYIDYVHPLDGTSLTQDEFLLNTTRNGIFYCTPINATAVGMLINKTAFDEAQVSYPTSDAERWTWEEFLAAVSEVVEKTDCEYGLVSDYSSQRYATILYQFGNSWFDPDDHSKVTFRSEETKAGIEFIMSLYSEGYAPVSVGIGTENAQSTFKTGKVAAHWAGNWVLSDYEANITDFEYAVTYAPYEKERATSLGGNFLYACEGTGVEAEAVEFIEWFFQPENYSIYCATGNFLPAKRNIYPDYNVAGLDIFNEEMNVSCETPSITSSVGAEHAGESYGEALKESLARAFVGELDADGVIDYVVEQILTNYTGTHE